MGDGVKVLLDANVALEVGRELAGHEVCTVAERGWAGIGNNELLAVAAVSGFDAVVIADRGFLPERYLVVGRVALILLRTPLNTARAQVAMGLKLRDALADPTPGSITIVSAWSRGR